MYVDIDSCGFVSLMQMDTEESASLAAMIRGAGLEERRVFTKVLQWRRRLAYESG